jgi:hypothetical protein
VAATFRMLKTGACGCAPMSETSKRSPLHGRTFAFCDARHQWPTCSNIAML